MSLDLLAVPGWHVSIVIKSNQPAHGDDSIEENNQGFWEVRNRCQCSSNWEAGGVVISGAR